MARTPRIALLGFSRTERAAFDAFFRVAEKRCPAYALANDLPSADFVILDAGDAQACATLREAGLTARAVALGEPPCEGAMLQLARPLNLMLVVRALDEVIARSHALADADVEVDGGIVGPDLVTLDDEIQLPPERKRRKGQPLDHILVVDDSDIALRFMASHLQRFGFQIHLARSGEEALERVARRHFEFVFLDVMMEGLDGFQTCKAIKRARYEGGKKPPTVVMLTCLGGAADKLRGTMAGADAYLVKPLREVELLKLVGDREIERYAYAETAGAMTTV
jgi:CheY-like chemotaxis protein